jgi:FkbH-like protein
MVALDQHGTLLNMRSELAAVDSSISSGETPAAVARLRDLFYRDPSILSARAVADRYSPKGSLVAGQVCKAWFLRSFTVEPVFPLLRAAALVEGLDLDVRAGDFNTYAQEILNSESAMYAFQPDVVFVAIQTRDLFPELREKTTVGRSESLSQSISQTLSDLRDWLTVLRTRTAATIIVLDFAMPDRIPGGMFAAQAETDASALIANANQTLRSIVGSMVGAYILPFSRVVDRIGRDRFYDERKWLTARMPFSAEAIWPVADACLRMLLPATGKVRKAIVVDLDNTMWGGVVGEDGPNGLKLGSEYPGAAFMAFQRALLECYERGIILAIASKNNEQDAMEVLGEHPAMLLRPSHFAARQINWNPKPDNLRSIAAALNIGTDSLIFIDDNPVERDEMRRQLPEVLVVELPADPMGYAEAVRKLAVLERLRVSAEDLDRGRQYEEQRQREDLHRASGSMEDFYRSLAMQVAVKPIAPATVSRAAQLTQKTNQFNLTTRRYDESRVAAMLNDQSWRTYACSVRDRFGDNGLVGVALVRISEGIWEIDTFLLSCRVIGRTVETGLLAKIAGAARAAGAERLTGKFISTAKNAPAQAFYQNHGFTLAGENESGSVWTLDLSASTVLWPDWLGDSLEGGAE